MCRHISSGLYSNFPVHVLPTTDDSSSCAAFIKVLPLFASLSTVDVCKHSTPRSASLCFHTKLLISGLQQPSDILNELLLLGSLWTKCRRLWMRRVGQRYTELTNLAWKKGESDFFPFLFFCLLYKNKCDICSVSVVSLKLYGGGRNESLCFYERKIVLTLWRLMTHIGVVPHR